MDNFALMVKTKDINVTKPGAIIIEGHVQGLSNVRSLGEAGIPVYVRDKTNCIARFSKYCKNFFICPEFKSEEFADFLLKIAQKNGIKGWMLVPSNDHAVLTIAKNKDRLEQYYKIISPELNIIENIYNKEKLIQSAVKSGVSISKSWFPKSYSELESFDLEFPILVKGKFGLNFYKQLGRKAFLINNENEFKKLISVIKNKLTAKNLFIQKLIPTGKNKTISCAVFSINGEIKTLWMGEKLRQHPIQFGTSTFSRSIYVEEIKTLSKKIIKEINFTGICEIEFLFDDIEKKYQLIEINARTWLWVGLAKSCGVDFVKIAYDYVNDINPKYPDKYVIDKYWIHLITDLPYSVIAILSGNLSLKSFFSSYFKNPIYGVFNLKDIVPSFSEFMLIPLMLLKRK